MRVDKSGPVRQMWRAIRQLNPGLPLRQAEKGFCLALVSSTEEDSAAMKAFLQGDNPSPADISSAEQVICEFRQPLDDARLRKLKKADIVLVAKGAEDGLPGGKRIVFDPLYPAETCRAVLDEAIASDLRLSIGRHLPAFRSEVGRGVVRDVSKENALFVITTALGTVIPTPLLPLIGIAETASDIIFLTANQVRMLFILAAVYGQKVGYVAQWREISSIIGAAFGWRTLARSLVSKIPFGAGLAPKGAVAYAGTTVIGEGLILLYTTGQRMGREQISRSFKEAYSGAVEVVRSMVGRLRPGVSTKEG